MMTSHIHHKFQTTNFRKLSLTVSELGHNVSRIFTLFVSHLFQISYSVSSLIKWLNNQCASAVEWPLSFQLNSFFAPIHVIEFIELTKSFPKYVLMHQMIVV